MQRHRLARERVVRDGFVLATGHCPMCGARALCVLPLQVLMAQPDDTNVVCHPLLGGCNHGFEAPGHLRRRDIDLLAYEGDA